jgi:hypothetical protein
VAILATAVDRLVPSKPLLDLTGVDSRAARIRTTDACVNAEPVSTSRHDTLARLVQNGRWHAIPLSCKGRLMIVAQPETEVREVAVPFCPNVRLPLILTISDEAPVRFPFVQVHRP